MDEYSNKKWRNRIKKRRGKSLHYGNIRELNLVAMMDMMTVVLVFLLKSYSVSAMSIPVGDTIQFPKSTNTLNPNEAIKLTITRSTEGMKGVLAVDEDRVFDLDKSKLAQLEEHAKRRDFLIPELKTALTKKADSIKFVASKNPSIKFEGKILVIADKDTPYWLITAVLYTAAESQFEQYNLVAMRINQD